MTLTIRSLILEAHDTLDRFWFVRDINIVDQTQATVTVHLTIGADLFVQAFLSESSQRLSFALVGQPEQHELRPEGMSMQPLTQFMAEVEKILVDHDLL